MVNKLKKTFNSLGHTFKKLRLLAVACVIYQVKKYFNNNYFISVFIYQLMINKPKNRLFNQNLSKKKTVVWESFKKVQRIKQKSNHLNQN